MTRAGTPTTLALGATSRVTTLPAPTTALRPIVTPSRILAPAPIQILSSIDKSLRSSRRSIPAPIRLDLFLWKTLSLLACLQ